MYHEEKRFFPPAAGPTSRREVLRRGAAIAAVWAIAPSWTAAQGAPTPFDHYISPDGSDGNPGTLAQPWAITSLQDTSPNNAKMQGKRTGLLPGTYSIGGMTSGSSPSNYEYSILAPPNGTASAVTFIGTSDASGNYSPRTATIVWSGAQTTNAIIGPNPNGSGYVTVDGLVINGGGLAGGHLFQVYSDRTDIYTTAGTLPGIVVQNCEMYGTNATDVGNNDSGVFLEGCAGALVQNNYFHDILKAPQPDHCHAYEEYGCQNCRILYNTLSNVSGGIESKAGSGGTEVAYNYIYNSPYAALVGFDGAEGNTNSPNLPYSIHHNVFDSNVGSAGYTVLSTDINLLIEQDVSFYNNTVYDPRAGGPFRDVGLAATNGASVSFYNNIMYCPSLTGADTSAHPGVINVSSGAVGTLDYNCYFMAMLSLGLDGNVYSTLSSWRAATSADGHAIAADPGFAVPAAGGKGAQQFQPGSASPCIGTGKGGVNIGAWDGKVQQIGCNFGPFSGSAPTVPSAPVLTVS